MASVSVNFFYVKTVPSWIIDSGATDMISYFSVLFNIRDVSKCVMLVNLPNGNTVPVKCIASCQLTFEIVLKKCVVYS